MQQNTIECIKTPGRHFFIEHTFQGTFFAVFHALRVFTRHFLQMSAVPHFSGHFVVLNAVHQAPVINLKDFTVKVPGSQANCTLQPCLRELVFALFSGKVPGSTQSAWEPGSQVPLFIDVCLRSHLALSAATAHHHHRGSALHLSLQRR